MSIDKANIMLADPNFSFHETKTYIEQNCPIAFHAVLLKQLNDSNKTKPKPEISYNQLVQLAIEAYGRYDERLEYAAIQNVKTGAWKVKIKDLAKNNKVLTAIVEPTLQYSIVDESPFLTDAEGNVRKIEPADVNRIRDSVEGLMGLKRTKVEITEAIHSVAYENKFNKYSDWIMSLQNNPLLAGKLDNWGHDVFGCADTPVINSGLKRWIVQLVAIALQPGRYREFMLYLINKHGGEGKTKFVRSLVPDPSWVYEGELSIENTQKAAQESAGCLICDFSDGGGLGKKDQNAQKRFITANRLTYVKKYENFSSVQKTYQSLIMTTNDPTPLPNLDMSVLRRSVPIEFIKLDAEKLLEVRDQLFYEAREYLAKMDIGKKPSDNECYVLQDKDKEEWIKYCSQYCAPSVLRSKITEYFDGTLLKEFYTKDEMLDLAKTLYKFSTNDETSRVLEELGFQYKRKEYIHPISGKLAQPWVWISPKHIQQTIEIEETEFQKKSFKEQIEIMDEELPELLAQMKGAINASN